MSGTIS